MEMKKHCRVCHTEDGEAFYKTHKTICWTCYKAEKSAAGKAYYAAVKEQEATRQEEQRRRERELYQSAHTCRDCGAPCEESISHAPRCVSCQNTHEAARPHAFCEDCKQAFAVDERGYLCVPYFEVHSTICTRCDKPLSIEYTDDGRVNFSCLGHTSGSGPALYGRSPKYCPTCRGERRKNNRQAYPLCPMCGTPTRVWDFLKTYQGYHLDIIKVCCTACIPQFEAQPEREQLAQLRSAMVKTYGETAVIYALQYDESFHCHHIGRTKETWSNDACLWWARSPGIKTARMSIEKSASSFVCSVVVESVFYSQPFFSSHVSRQTLRHMAY